MGKEAPVLFGALALDVARVGLSHVAGQRLFSGKTGMQIAETPLESHFNHMQLTVKVPPT